MKTIYKKTDNSPRWLKAMMLCVGLMMCFSAFADYSTAGTPKTLSREFDGNDAWNRGDDYLQKRNGMTANITNNALVLQGDGDGSSARMGYVHSNVNTYTYCVFRMKGGTGGENLANIKFMHGFDDSYSNANYKSISTLLHEDSPTTMTTSYQDFYMIAANTGWKDMNYDLEIYLTSNMTIYIDQIFYTDVAPPAPCTTPAIMETTYCRGDFNNILTIDDTDDCYWQTTRSGTDETYPAYEGTFLREDTGSTGTYFYLRRKCGALWSKADSVLIKNAFSAPPPCGATTTVTDTYKGGYSVSSPSNWSATSTPNTGCDFANTGNIFNRNNTDDRWGGWQDAANGTSPITLTIDTKGSRWFDRIVFQTQNNGDYAGTLTLSGSNDGTNFTEFFTTGASGGNAHFTGSNNDRRMDITFPAQYYQYIRAYNPGSQTTGGGYWSVGEVYVHYTTLAEGCGGSDVTCDPLTSACATLSLPAIYGLVNVTSNEAIRGTHAYGYGNLIVSNSWNSRNDNSLTGTDAFGNTLSTRRLTGGGSDCTVEWTNVDAPSTGTYRIRVNTYEGDTDPNNELSITVNGTLAGSISTASNGWSNYLDIPLNSSCVNSILLTHLNAGNAGVRAIEISEAPSCTTPTASYNLTTDKTTLCTGETTTIAISNSQTGVTYKLYRDGSNLVESKAGTGGGFTFATAINTAGTYTVKAIGAAGNGTYCEVETAAFTGSTVVIAVNADRSITRSGGAASQSVCAGTAITAINYAVGNASANTIVWTGSSTSTPAGLSVSNTATAVSIDGTPTTAGTYTYTITPTGCGTATATGTITVNSKPTQPTTITASATQVCPNTTGLTYSVTNVDGATYTWTLPAGWNVTAGGTTNSITATASAVGGDISVTTAKDGCTSDARTLLVSIKSVTAVITPATQTETIETAADQLTAAITQNNGATYTNLQWYVTTENNNTSGTAVTGETGLTYTPPTTATGTLYYYVKMTDGCGAEVKSAQVSVIVTAQTEPATNCTETGDFIIPIITTTQSATIDMAADAVETVWNNVDWTSMIYDYSGNAKYYTGTTPYAQIKVLSDGTDLYYLIDIPTSECKTYSNNADWAGDCVELFLGNSGQIIVPLGYSGSAWTDDLSTAEYNQNKITSLRRTKTTNGARVKVKIALSTVGIASTATSARLEVAAGKSQTAQWYREYRVKIFNGSVSDNIADDTSDYGIGYFYAPDLTVTDVTTTSSNGVVTVTGVTITNAAATAKTAVDFSVTPAKVKFNIGGVWREVTINTGTIAIGGSLPVALTTAQVPTITLADGNYTLTAKVHNAPDVDCDNNTYTTSVTVLATPTPSLSLTGTNCVVSGAVSAGNPVTLQDEVINNGNAPQAEEDFTVTYTFNGSTYNQTVTPSALTANGGTQTVSYSGFTAPAYNGTYQATVTVNGTSKTCDVIVTGGQDAIQLTTVAGPFYIKNWYVGVSFSNQYLHDDETNSYIGTSYNDYNFLRKDCETAEYESGAENYQWVIREVSYMGASAHQYLIQNVGTGRYWHTGAYGADGTTWGNLGNRTMGLYEWDESLVAAATAVNGTTDANKELSYYLFSFSNATGALEDGYEKVLITTRRYDEDTNDYLHGENCESDAKTYFAHDFASGDNDMSTRYWRFIPAAPQVLPDPEVTPSAGNCELTLDWTDYNKSHASSYAVYVYNDQNCAGNLLFADTIDVKNITIPNSALNVAMNTILNVSFKVIALSDQGEDYNSLGTCESDIRIACEPVFEVVNPYVVACEITESSVTLEATIRYQGDGSIAQYGTVLSTDFNLVKPQTVSPADVKGVTADLANENGGWAGTEPDTVVFTHVRTGLDPQTEYYFTGFAVNTFDGKKYSDYGSFYTLSAPATTSDLTVALAVDNKLQVSGVAFPENGVGATKGGYLVLYTQTENPLTLNECPNGKNPAEVVPDNISFSLMNEDTLSIRPPDLLLPKLPNAKCGETYYVKVIPYTWDGRHAQTYNYGTASVSLGGKTYTGASYAPYNPARKPWLVGEIIQAEDWDYGCGALLGYSESAGANNTYRDDHISTQPKIRWGDRSPISLYLDSVTYAVQDENGDGSGEFTQYTVYIEDDGYYALRIHAATGSDNASIAVKFLDVNDNTTVLYSSPENASVINKGADYFNNVNTRQIYLDRGEYRMRLYYAGSVDINVDWITLEPACFAIVSTNTAPAMTKDTEVLKGEWSNTPTVQIQFPVRLQDDSHTVDYFRDYLPAGQWQAKYDEDSVYFYIQVNEEEINTSGGWDGDAVEIYFSPLNGNAAKVCQLGFPVVTGTYATGAIISDGRATSSEAGYSSYGNADANEHIPARYVMFKTADGYAMRVNIAWSVIPGFSNFEDDIAAENGIPMEVVVSKAIPSLNDNEDGRDMQIASFSKVRMNASGNGADDQLYKNTNLLTKVKFFKTVEDFDPYAAIYKVPAGAQLSYSLEGSIKTDGSGEAAVSPLNLVQMVKDAYTALKEEQENEDSDLYWEFDIAYREAAEPANTRHELDNLALPNPMFGDKDYYVYTEIKGCQQASGTFHIKFQIEEEIDTIIWINKTGNGLWKDRQNWINPNTGVAVNAYTTFGENLTVVIPATTGSKYEYLIERNADRRVTAVVNTDGETVYPNVQTIQEDIDNVRITDNIATDGKIVSKLIVEYGGATYIKPFVNNGTSKYDKAHVELVINSEDRGEWVLVGPHILPNGTDTMVSSNFYLNKEPNVYMHELQISRESNGSSAEWQNSFPDLDVKLSDTSCFAIKIPNDYGPNHLTSAAYWRRGTAEQKAYGTKAIEYVWDSAKLTNENAVLNIKDTDGRFKILCNTFLSNICVGKLLDKLGEGSMVAVWSFGGDAGTEFTEPLQGSFLQCEYYEREKYQTTYIKPMQAFVYLTANGNKTLQEADVCVVNNVSTGYKARSVAGRKPVLKLNANIGSYGSDGYLIYNDELESSAYSPLKDYDKLFTGGMYSQVPQIYFDLGEHRLHTQTFASLYDEINLGIRYGEEAGMATLKFAGVDEFDEVYLVDKATGTTYDLYTADSVNVTIAGGDNADRFVIKFRSSNPIITGEGETATEKTGSVKIYSEDNQNVTVSASTAIMAITVLGINGQTLLTVQPKAAYTNINLGAYPAGVYVVKAVTETDSATGKVIIK